MVRDEASWELTKRLYEQGFSSRQVSAMTNVCQTTILYRLRKQGVAIRPAGQHANAENRLSHDDLAKTAFMYEQREMSCNEIARELGISHSTVMWRLRRAGVPIRDNSEQQKLAWKKRHRAAWAAV